MAGAVVRFLTTRSGDTGPAERPSRDPRGQCSCWSSPSVWVQGCGSSGSAWGPLLRPPSRDGDRTRVLHEADRRREHRRYRRRRRDGPHHTRTGSRLLPAGRPHLGGPAAPPLRPGDRSAAHCLDCLRSLRSPPRRAVRAGAPPPPRQPLAAGFARAAAPMFAMFPGIARWTGGRSRSSSVSRWCRQPSG